MVLLVGAGLIGKSFYRLLQVSAGFETKHLITMRLRAPVSAYGEDPQALALQRKVVDQIKSLPGVSSVALAKTLPLNFNGNTDWVRFVGRAYNGEQSLMPAMADAIRAIDSRINISNQTTMMERVNTAPTVYLRRSSTWLVGAFAVVALLLGVVGLYGVIAYSVSQRTREIGVRIALGAQRNSVYRLILKEAGALALAGIVIGTGCAILAASLMRKLLFGTPPWDITTLVSVAVVLGGSALLASFLPARRAASIDPISALRAE